MQVQLRQIMVKKTTSDSNTVSDVTDNAEEDIPVDIYDDSSVTSTGEDAVATEISNPQAEAEDNSTTDKHHYSDHRIYI